MFVGGWESEFTLERAPYRKKSLLNQEVNELW